MVLAVSCLLFASRSATVQQPSAPPLQRSWDPPGEIVLNVDGSIAEGSLPVGFVRSPDISGPGGDGRYLIAVNSGYGVQVDAKGNVGQQLLQVIDLNAHPVAVVQSIYFPSPQSANVGVAFGRRTVTRQTHDRRAESADHGLTDPWPLYVAGGVENRIWRFTFTLGAERPLSPAHGPTDGVLTAPSIALRSEGRRSANAAYNDGREPLYPTGLAVSRDGRELYVANNLGDSLSIVRDESGEEAEVVDLRPAGSERSVYPYDVRVAGPARDREKVYISCWNDSSVVVVDPRRRRVIRRIAVGSHPTAILATADGDRLFVVNANDDSVSVIDTGSAREVERISVTLANEPLRGHSPQALALSDNERMLFVANAQTQSVAVVALGGNLAAVAASDTEDKEEDDDANHGRSRVVGYVPTARYPSALAVVGDQLFVGNGKGEPAPRPNAPTPAFPATSALRGPYIASLVRSTIRRVPLPTSAELAALTSRVLQANGFTGPRVDRLFAGPSPITHVIYVIKENRTYDQVFGDLPASGDGTAADGDPSLAIFGHGHTARRGNGPPQDITPNHRALALRFGLFDRFFVNSEASPDGHNWSTAAFSTDYVDKSFRWSYSGRGRSYDYEGFNRAPGLDAKELPSGLRLPATAETLAAFLKRFIPYLNGGRDIAEPDSLYLWDAAARAGRSYRNYGEFIGTLSAADVTAVNARKQKLYPDLSPTVVALPTKATLEGNFSPVYRAFDLLTPDAIVPESYLAARTAAGLDPVIAADHPDPRFRGTSRLGVWLDDFRRLAADLEAGRGDRMPSLTIMALPNDHTSGLTPGQATPQFLVADNDYALGRLVEAVSHSPYWKSTAILVVEDDAQDGPDHVDAHRSVALVISAFNRPGQLVHAVHNTVSLIRTLELLIGLPPMNLIDASATPMDIFQEHPDLTPYTARLPNVSQDNLIVPAPTTAQERHWARATQKLVLAVPDAANPLALNAAIWFSVRGADHRMPTPKRFALVDAMSVGIDDVGQESARAPLRHALLSLRTIGRQRLREEHAGP